MGQLEAGCNDIKSVTASVEEYARSLVPSTTEECAQLAEAEAKVVDRINKRAITHSNDGFHVRIVAKRIRNRFGITSER